MKRIFTSIVLLCIALFAHTASARPQQTIDAIVWLDANCNGVKEDTDPPIQGQYVWLIAPGADGKANTDDDRMIESSGSGPTGRYFFTLGRAGIEVSMRILDRGQSIFLRPAPLGPDNVLRDDWTTAGFYMSDTETLTDKNIGLCRSNVIALPMVMN
jgi:hypothetical protein